MTRFIKKIGQKIHPKIYPKDFTKTFQSAVGGQKGHGQKTKQNFNNKLIVKILLTGVCPLFHKFFISCGILCWRGSSVLRCTSCSSPTSSLSIRRDAQCLERGLAGTYSSCVISGHLSWNFLPPSLIWNIHPFDLRLLSQDLGFRCNSHVSVALCCAHG